MATAEPGYAPTLTGSGAFTTPVTVAITAAATGSNALSITNNSAATSGDSDAIITTGTFNPASGAANYCGVEVNYTINQTGTSSGVICGLKIDATETAVLGTHNLLLLRVGGASKLTLTGAGVLSLAATGTLVVPSGTSLSSVAVQVSGDANTGAGAIGGADTFSVVCGGTETARFGVGTLVIGNITVPTISSVASATNGWGNLRASSGGGRTVDVRAYGSTASGTSFGLTNALNTTIVAVGPLGLGPSSASDLTLGTNDIARLTITSVGLAQLALSATVASAAGAVWDAFDLKTATLTLSGSTNITTATGANMAVFRIPTYSAASALTVTNAATIYVAGAPAGGGAGPATITNAYSVWVDAGPARFDGNLDLSAGGQNVVLDTTTGSKIGTGTTQKLGFYNATPVVQQTRGATTTNSVTAGGTDDTIANYTDLTLYANDAAAIRNNLYQLARIVRLHDVALRALGLES